jgi:Ca-activated chloride channel family protein
MLLSYNKSGNNYAALKLVKSEYHVDITGIIAQVNIKQSFHNDGSEWIKEGMYAFPVAQNAAVYQMKLIIGKRVIEGEIHEKQQAQEIYDEAKSQGLSASLVKQYRPNLFTTDIANIMPNERIEVEISYQQSLTYDAGHIDFRLPLAIKNRYMQERFLPDSNATNLGDTDLLHSTVIDQQQRLINIKLEAGFELSELTSLNHDVTIQHSAIMQTISLNDRQLYDKHDFVLRWYPTLGAEPQAAMFSEKLAGEEYVLMMLLPSQTRHTNINKQARELVFIIDTSGSMHGDAINAAKDALLFGLTQLSENDLFNVVEFNSYSRELFKHSVIANSNNLSSAIDFIDALQADGGTNMAPALSFAMKDKVKAHYLKQIVFITDGSVGNEAQLFNQINQDIADARLFTVAIGAAPNNYFMSKAAHIGRGTYTNVDKLNEVDNSMSELFTKLSSPALTNVAISWDIGTTQSPALIPDLYQDQPIIVTAKMKHFNPDIVISGLVENKAWSNNFTFNQDGRSKGVARLWARNQIKDLTDDYMLGADIDALHLQQQITTLALKYHLVSEFTSLVAVDKTPDISRLVQLQATAMNQLETLAEVNFPQTDLGWKWRMLLGLLLIMIAFLSRRIRA